MINKQLKSRVSTAIRSLDDSVEKKEEKKVQLEKLASSQSLIDKGVKKGIFHKIEKIV